MAHLALRQIAVAAQAQVDCQENNLLGVLAAAAASKTVQMQSIVPPEAKRPCQELHVALLNQQVSCDDMNIE